ncbi:CvpA family protein [Comamonadaceae bacterium M7527]|nr:CvpA family protein [Comamonadaceae bacterium M7527]
MNWSALDTAMSALLGASLVWGAWRGLVYELLAIANWLFAVMATSLVAPLLAQWVPALEGTGLLALVVRYVVVFVVFVFVGGFVASTLRRWISASGLRPADRSLGALFGLVRGVVVLLVAALVVLVLKLEAEPWWSSSSGAQLLQSVLVLLKPVLPQAIERLIP